MSSCIRRAVGVWLSYHSLIHLWWIAFAISVIWNSEHQLSATLHCVCRQRLQQVILGDQDRRFLYLRLRHSQLHKSVNIPVCSLPRIWSPLGINQMCLSHYTIRSDLYACLYIRGKERQFPLLIPFTSFDGNLQVKISFKVIWCLFSKGLLI